MLSINRNGKNNFMTSLISFTMLFTLLVYVAYILYKVYR